ncbi:tetratricopeptide repeat protein [Altererythrobacter sp. ZODW24]|uniref:tetratricopeptide repeat protein n=1 Tax=Altererythrobacter sp. ZODW24 TaxID=2185142 RepID=UPI000DF856CE|nr:tetratricopeptide repeat protein [Altererythrobacter sp. ZODW24]
MTSTSILARKRAAFRPASHLVLALALATGAFAASAVTAPAAYAQDKPKYSKKFQKAGNPAAEALQQLESDAELAAIVTQLSTADDAAKPALRQQLVAKTDIVNKLTAMNAAVETADDRYTAGQYTLNWGVKSADTQYQQQGLMLSLESGKTPVDKIGQYSWFVGTIAFQKEDYTTAQTYLRRAIDAGWNQNSPASVLGESYYRAGDITGGAKVIMELAESNPALVDEDAIRGSLKYAYDDSKFYEVVKLVTLLKDRFPSEDATSYYNNVPRQAAGDMPVDALNADIARLLAEENSPANWSFAANAIVENGNFTESESVDAMRLLKRTKALRRSSEYRDYLTGLNPTLYPTEAQSVLDEGIAGGFVSASDFSEAAAQARANAGSDKEYLGDASNRRRAASNPKVATSMANTALSLGDAATAQAMFELVVSNGGVDIDTALIRLGIARLDQGNYAGAREAFGRVTGKHKGVAGLWSTYANTQESSAATTM